MYFVDRGRLYLMGQKLALVTDRICLDTAARVDRVVLVPFEDRMLALFLSIDATTKGIEDKYI